MSDDGTDRIVCYSVSHEGALELYACAYLDGVRATLGNGGMREEATNELVSLVRDWLDSPNGQAMMYDRLGDVLAVLAHGSTVDRADEPG